MARSASVGFLTILLLLLTGETSHASTDEREVKGMSDRLSDQLIWPSNAGHSLRMPGCLDYAHPGWKSRNIRKIAVRPRPEISEGEEGWFGEDFFLDIYFKNEKPLTIPFYAAHGTFDVMVAEDLWQSRNAFVVLIRQTVKGTGVSEHELDIFEAKDGAVRALLEKKIAGDFDFFGDLWRYRLFITATAVDSEKPLYGLELRYEQDRAREEFVRKGLVAKDAEFGKNMPRVICLTFHEQELHEYDGKRCRDIDELE